MASGSSQLEGEESSAVLQLLGVTKTLLANVSAQCTLCPTNVMIPSHFWQFLALHLPFSERTILSMGERQQVNSIEQVNLHHSAPVRLKMACQHGCVAGLMTSRSLCRWLRARPRLRMLWHSCSSWWIALQQHWTMR